MLMETTNQVGSAPSSAAWATGLRESWGSGVAVDASIRCGPRMGPVVSDAATTAATTAATAVPMMVAVPTMVCGRGTMRRRLGESTPEDEVNTDILSAL